MKNTEIEQLFHKPEGEDLMLYQNFPHTTLDLAISIAAIANTDGGHIIFGIKKRHRKNKYYDLKSYNKEVLINNALELLRKEPVVEWKPYIKENKEIVILNINKTKKPIKIGQDVYIMEGIKPIKKKLTKPQNDKVDIIIVCPLVKEAKNAKQVFEKYYDQEFNEFEDDNNDIHYFAIVEDMSILITWSPKMGLEKIRDAVEKVVKKYKPSYVVMTGICAGNKNDTRMGDIVIASKTIPYGRGSDDNEGFKPETSTSELSDTLKRKIDTIEIDEILEIFTLEHPNKSNQSQLYFAPMASVYTVKKDGKIFNEVLKIDRKVKAVDMEMAGFYEKMRTIRDEAIIKKTNLMDVEWFGVKGVCDYATEEKDDRFQDYAAQISAAVAIVFINKYCKFKGRIKNN